MNEFHTARAPGVGEPSLGERGVAAAEAQVRGGTTTNVEDESLKAARAEAVEFVVKAFAAVDRNLALADKARARQEKSEQSAQRDRLEAQRELAAAREIREATAREMAEAHARSDSLLREARAECERMLNAARARCKAESESTRRQVAEALLPLRNVIDRAGDTIGAFCAEAEPAIDLREMADDETSSALVPSRGSD